MGSVRRALAPRCVRFRRQLGRTAAKRRQSRGGRATAGAAAVVTAERRQSGGNGAASPRSGVSSARRSGERRQNGGRTTATRRHFAARAAWQRRGGRVRQNGGKTAAKRRRCQGGQCSMWPGRPLRLARVSSTRRRVRAGAGPAATRVPNRAWPAFMYRSWQPAGHQGRFTLISDFCTREFPFGTRRPESVQSQQALIARIGVVDDDVEEMPNVNRCCEQAKTICTAMCRGSTLSALPSGR
jgi:hypothetical protein